MGDLGRGALLEGDVGVEADLQQCGAEAPFVGRRVEIPHVLNALRGDPWDPIHAFWGGGGEGGTVWWVWRGGPGRKGSQ